MNIDFVPLNTRGELRVSDGQRQASFYNKNFLLKENFLLDLYSWTCWNLLITASFVILSLSWLSSSEAGYSNIFVAKLRRTRQLWNKLNTQTWRKSVYRTMSTLGFYPYVTVTLPGFPCALQKPLVIPTCSLCRVTEVLDLKLKTCFPFLVVTMMTLLTEGMFSCISLNTYRSLAQPNELNQPKL